jgi:hypothetical protein
MVPSVFLYDSPTLCFGRLELRTSVGIIGQQTASNEFLIVNAMILFSIKWHASFFLSSIGLIPLSFLLRWCPMT